MILAMEMARTTEAGGKKRRERGGVVMDLGFGYVDVHRRRQKK